MKELLQNRLFHRLCDAFDEEGLEIRFVGGCVRDALMGRSPRDIDLVTDAFFGEIATICERNDFFYRINNAHGTVCVIDGDDMVEITPRKGATWLDDLSMRDFTMNAMTLSRDGTLFDPFGGRGDIMGRKLSFVGNMEDRIREDPLRLMRMVRFKVVFNMRADFDIVLVGEKFGHFIKDVAKERVWNEIKELINISRENGIFEDQGLRVLEHIGLTRELDLPRFTFCQKRNTQCDPVSVFAMIYRDRQSIAKVANVLKWSRDETEKAFFIFSISDAFYHHKITAKIIFENPPTSWINECEALHRIPLLHLKPLAESFMVTSSDIMSLGVDAGPKIGQILRKARRVWADGVATDPERADRFDREMMLRFVKQWIDAREVEVGDHVLAICRDSLFLGRVVESNVDEVLVAVTVEMRDRLLWSDGSVWCAREHCLVISDEEFALKCLEAT